MMATKRGSTLVFLRNLRRRPRNTGAFLPSGPVLAKVMASNINPAIEGAILELGPGTGVFTQAMIDRGIDPKRLYLIEYNPDFVRYLRKRFPQVTVIHGSAFDVAKICNTHQILPLAGIISGLPLLNFPTEMGESLIKTSMTLLAPQAQYVQFTYSQRPSIPAPEGTSVRLAKRVWLNLPPASVWVYAPNTAQAA